MEYRPITGKHDKVIIVATGTSLAGVDLTRLEGLAGVTVVAINLAYCFFKPDYWFSVSRNPEHFAILYEQKPKCPRILANRKEFAVEHMLKPYPDKEWLVTEDKAGVNTLNSAHGAINLAYHWQAKKVLLLGCDCDGKGYFYGPFPKPKSWGQNLRWYKSILPQLDWVGMEILNASPQSQIDAFPKANIESGLNWING